MTNFSQIAIKHLLRTPKILTESENLWVWLSKYVKIIFSSERIERLIANCKKVVAFCQMALKVGLQSTFNVMNTKCLQHARN